ncbi:MAG TPA: valine--tRNA ligase [Candidatus Krumholzibacteria bacterium]|nr:valine--tRNA ligase [Candidatus Krumholzibacteria bacterium]
MNEANLADAYDPGRVEPVWYARWMQARAFTPRAATDGEGETPFVVLLPPPNVTGSLHMGHVLSSTIQDVFVRYQRMRGRETLWWPGTDHAGIATQKVVERGLRQQGIEPRQLGREEFIARCWEWKQRSHEHIVRQMQRVGWSLDWEREYFTLDEERSHAVREVFIRLYDKGLVYRGRYITHWCPACRTALSDEEVVHEETQATLWTVRYPLVQGGSIEVATTRPETIVGDVAVAIHPDDPRTAALVGQRVRLPLVGREIPILADASVDMEFGSGLVKITPAHDANDFHVGKRHGLDMPVVIDPDGRMNALAGPLAGLDRFAARDEILRRLEAEGLLAGQKPHTLSRGTHDRCGSVIEPYLSDQWFVRMQPLAAAAIRAVEDGRLHFTPERWRNVYLHWMHNIQDWCISRQLWWGHRIPIYTCKGCALMLAAHAAPAQCTRCGGHDFAQDEDVLDTWFSSWLCPFSPMGWPRVTADLERYHPTTLLVTGPDIIFFWVARMVMASLEFMGTVPFEHVLLNGILRDGQGRKMSKSLGNSPEPIALMDAHGADAVRFAMVMLSPPGQDTFFDDKLVETGRHFANKIWNAARLVLNAAARDGWDVALGLGATAGAPAGAQAPQVFQAASASDAFTQACAGMWQDAFARALPAEALGGLRLEDRWILHAYDETVRAIATEMQALRANEAASRLYHFFWDEYCAWYLESIKPRIYGEDIDSKRTGHVVALVLLAQSCKLLSPFMPFLAEELWSRTPGTQGLVLTAAFPRPVAALRDAEAAERFGLMMQATGALRTLRSELRVPPGKKAPALVHSASGTLGAWSGETGELLMLHAKLASLAPVKGRPPESAAVVVGDGALYVPLGALVDLDAERERLTRELEKADGDLARLEAKLANRGFVDKAPAAVVDAERQRREQLIDHRARIVTSLSEMSGKG